MPVPNTLLEQLDTTFEKIASIKIPQDNAAEHAIKEILQRFVIISKDIVTYIKVFKHLHIIERDNARICISNSIAVRDGQEIQPPRDALSMNVQSIPDFPRTLLELQHITAERQIALLEHFGVSAGVTREMGEEAAMLALRVWCGCRTFY